MRLPVNPPVLPMLAKRVAALPEGPGWIFEPKWDGFRTLIFRDGDEILIQSRDEKPLNRYFPDLLDPLSAQLPFRCVLDGEIVIVKNGGLEFDSLQFRLHPAASRVKLFGGGDSILVRVFRFALGRRSGLASGTVRNSPPGTGISALFGGAAHPHHTGDQRPSGSSGLVSAASKVQVSTASWPRLRRAFMSPTNE